MADTEKIAVFHYKTEQNIRALSMYGGNIRKTELSIPVDKRQAKQEDTPLTLPPAWTATTEHLRETLLKRAAFLEESGLHEYIEKSFEDGQVEGTVHKQSHGYGRFFVRLYLAFFEGRANICEAISRTLSLSLSS